MNHEPIESQFFVRRPIVAIVIAIITVIVGAVFLIGLPIEQYPNLTPPVVEVRATYTGANSLSVEQSVAAPLEQEINGVENMIYMKSTNSNDGTMTINISFEIGSNPDMNTVFAQNRASAATAKLPEDVKKFGVNTQKTMPNILMVLSLSSENGAYNQNYLGNYAIINIKDELARLKGVGRVNTIGVSDYSMRIWAKPDALAKSRVTVPEMIAAVKGQNVIVPGGKFGAEPAPPGTEFTYTVQLPERLRTEEEFGNIVVRTDKDGSEIRIRDLARVELGVESYNAFTRVNGKESAVILIYPAPGANAVALSQQIRATMDGLSKKFPEGVRYDVSLDSSKSVTEGINEIIHTLFEALFLVIVVVFLFIQDWRATLIPTLAIPVSLIGAFILFPLMGFSINVLSLLGIVLAIGIVVDDAIVVVEAVQHNMEHGLSVKDATNKAMKEVTAPIIATMLVLAAVFVPVAAMSGITGRIYQQFAITIAVSVFFSTINALSLTPALCSLILKPKQPSTGWLSKFFAGFNKAFDRSTRSYMGLTNVVARKLTRSSIFIVITVVLAGVFGKLIPGGFIPEEDEGYLYVNVQMPNASSLQRTDEVAKKVEALLGKVEEVDKVTNISGFSLLSNTFSPSNGFMFVSLKEWGEREATVKDVIRRLNGIFATQVPGAQVFAFGPPAIPGLGNGSGFSIMLQDKGGNTPEYLSDQTKAFMAEAMKRPEIGIIFTTYQSTVPQKYIDLNVDKIFKAGVSIQDVYTTFGAFLGGAYINDFNRFGRLYKAYVQAEPESRQNEEGLNLFYVKNRDGDAVPLSTFVTVKDISGPDYTQRFNLFRSVELTGSPAAGYTSADALAALEDVAKTALPSDMGYSWNAMSYQEMKSAGSAAVIFIFSFVFVYLILAAQYESWSLPFSIVLGTPFVIFGAFLFLYISRFFSLSYENNIFVQVSLVLLIGMAAKNAILIIEYAKLKFDEGMSLFDAAMESARLRFRPILMTVFAFMLGVLPLVKASGAGAEARKVMGMALLGGIGIATLLGVFIYPMLFVLVGKLAKYEQKRELTKKAGE